MRARVTLALAIVALAGCGDIIGLGGYTDAPDGSIDGSLDGSLDADAAKNDAGDGATADAGDGASADAGDAGDAAPDVVVADGGACGSGSVCVPDLPAGWTWSAYALDARPACATGYATPTDVEEGIDASAPACGCTCTTTAPDCATGNLTFSAGNGGGCNSVTSQTGPATAGCQSPTAFTTNNGSSISVTGPAPSGGSCTPVPSETVPPVGYDHQGRTCAYGGDAGVACGSGNVCVPDPAPFAMCVAQPGVNACPSGFPTQHLVGTSVDDTRSCTACGCTFDAGACTGSASFYSSGNCSFGKLSVAVDGTCHFVGGHTFRSYDYAPTTNASCTPSTVAPDGGVVFTDVTTVCCP